MSDDASAWLLERYDKGNAPRTGWTRSLFQVLRDSPAVGSADEPRPSMVAARWPTPVMGDDLDEHDERIRERNTGPVRDVRLDRETR